MAQGSGLGRSAGAVRWNAAESGRLTGRVVFAPATKEWQKALLSRCGLEMPVDEKLTRGQFAALIWQKLEKQPLKPWGRLKPGDADGDGVLDLDDPQPFGALESRP